jgi:hypothetical protein
MEAVAGILKTRADQQPQQGTEVGMKHDR